MLFFESVQTITSRRNALVARCRDIARGQSDGLMLLDGAHLVSDALHAGIRIREAVAASAALDRDEIQGIVRDIDTRGIPVAAAAAPVMEALSPGPSPSRLLAIAERPAGRSDHLFADPDPLVIIAAGVQDPGNMGAIIRVAEAGGASGVISAGDSADPFGWKALRGSMGSALRLPLATHGDLTAAIADARRHRCRIVATVPRGGQSPEAIDLTGPVALVIGGEGAGVPADVADRADLRVSIPMQAPVESLNTSVAAAIVIYEARRQRAKGRPSSDRT